jgi:uncharacterized protein (DUF58 family)
VSPSTPDGRQPFWRTANAAFTGLFAGACGVVLARALFGPEMVVAGAIIGTVSLVVGVALSWSFSVTRRRRRTSVALPGGQWVRRRMRPVAWFGPVAGSVVAMLAWAGVAHSSGSGWVQAVGALLAAVLLTGIVAPAVPARRATVACTECPSDGQAGWPLAMTLVTNGPVRLRPRYPAGPPARAEGTVRGPRPVEVTVTPDRRGVVDTLVVEVATSAPFGILWWAKDVMVELPRPLHVAPRTGEPGPPPTVTDDALGEAPLRVPAGLGEPRGVRPYQSGDLRRSVHWPATAHAGVLMVRETERQRDDPIVIDVVLPDDPARAEAETERVMAAVTGFLARGRPVVLGTDEREGRALRPVRDRIDLGRRLARAVPPPGVAPPTGSPHPVPQRERR